MAVKRKKIEKLIYMITDRMDLKLGLAKIDENSPEYIGMCSVVTDEMADIALAMGRRKFTTPEKIAKKMHKSEAYIQEQFDKMSRIGLLEYDWDNEDHHKQWQVPHFVVGCGEYMACHEQFDGYGTTVLAKMFDRMTIQPLEPLVQYIPEGGAGVGMQTVPVEKAIPNKNEAMSYEQLSYWLDKADGQFSVFPCLCRIVAQIDGESNGEMPPDLCIGVGDAARYANETKMGRPATREEVEEILRRSEDNGYVHQVNRGDGSDKIYYICNCDMGTCRALRLSQLFNTPNMSASPYRAEVDPAKCVACGKCAEICPAGAAKLGQKLCTKNGPVVYPKQVLPDDTVWGKHMWNYNYRNDNTKTCYDTGTSPCKSACPAHIAIQGYLKMASEGNYLEALKLIKQDNPFPAVCGSICNRRCEGACTRGTIDDPVSIDEIKRFVASLELKEENRYIPEKRYHKGNTEPYEEKIAIIGGGPAGLSCAYFLAGMGYCNVTVFDKNAEPGGMMMYGIPNFRLEKDVVRAEIDVLSKMGVHFRNGTDVGRDITIEQLRKEGYKGFYVAIGLQNGGRLGVPGDDAKGVMSGAEFMKKVNSGEGIRLKGKCVVIGGGNIGADVARTAVRLGAEDVTLYCLEGYDEMPMGIEDRTECENEGIKIRAGWGQTEVITEKGACKGVHFRKCISVRNSEGRFAPVFDDSVTEDAECETLLHCIGQKAEWGTLLEGAKVELNTNKTAKADAVTLQTAEPDVFVGGDVYTGQKFVIDAIAAGRNGAISLHRYVQKGCSLTMARQMYDYHELDKDNIALEPSQIRAPRRQQVQHDSSKALTMHDDRLLFTEEMVKAETSRCLGCGASIVDQNRCIGCGLCTTKCNFDAIHLVRSHPAAADMVYIEDVYGKVAMRAVERAGKITIKKIKTHLDKINA